MSQIRAHVYLWSSTHSSGFTKKRNFWTGEIQLSSIFRGILIFLFLNATFQVGARQRKKDNPFLAHQTIADKTSKSSVQQQIELLNGLAKQYRFRNPDSLIYFAEKLSDFSEKWNNENGKALAQIRKGEYYSDIGNNQKALQKYLEIEPIIAEIGNPELVVELQTQMAIEYFFLGELESTLRLAYQGLRVSELNGLTRLEARLRHVLGYVYTQNRLYDEADKELAQAINLWKVVKDSLNLFAARSNLARNSILKGDVEKAKKYFQGNLNFFQRWNEPLWLARSHMVESHIYRKNNEWKKALESNIKYDSLLQFLSNPRDRILTFNIFSEVYIHEKEYIKAKNYADSTLKYAHQLKDSFELLNGYTNLKDVALAKGDYSRAVDYLNLLLPIREVLERKSGEDNLKLLRAKLELEYRTLEEEIQYNKKILVQRRVASVMLLILALALGILLYIRKVAQRRKVTNQKLRELNQTKNKVFSIIGHDLKSPINTLQELFEMYSNDGITSKDISKMIPKLKDNVDHSAFELNNLLFWARTHMEGLKPLTKPVVLKQKTNEVCEQYGSKFEKKKIRVTCGISKNIKVRVDPLHLEIALRNLILNAIKFTPEDGEIHFDSEEMNGLAKITICDSGIGMEPLQIKNVLSGNSVESKPGTNGEKGTGIGLQITKDLIDINNGELHIESNTDEGSCFHILLPLA